MSCPNARNVCGTCSKMFSKKNNLNRHLREVHGEIFAFEENLKSFHCLEGCSISFEFHKSLVTHLKEMHSISIELEERSFSNIESKGFYIYLYEFQNNQHVEYVKPRGKVTQEEREIFYLYCSRSGKCRKNKVQLHKRVPKTPGSKKINFNCTSQIKVIRDMSNLSVFIKFYKTHYGHSMDLQHLRISKTDKGTIAQKLASGVSITRIIDDNRENFDGDALKRMDLLTRKDVVNIKKSYNIQIQEGVHHNQDAVSVDMFVQECAMMENSPILFYKAQGLQCQDEETCIKEEDFCIIIMNHSQQHMLTKFGNHIVAIDSTHGINAYDFELTTLLVIDEWGEGFPGACMITNRKDTQIFEIFFKQIKSKIGTLQPNVFMSDITTVFYNGWKNVMGEVPSQLYCAWHIDRAWQSNLTKIQNLDKRKLVYQSLKMLQTVSSIDEFHKLLPSFLKELEEDQETWAFGEYFQKNYGANYLQWAYCYRQNCGINTNMRLEAMHKGLKYFYLNAKKVRRLDKGIHALNKFIRDKVVDRIIKTVKGKNSKHIQIIHSRHTMAVSSTFEIEWIEGTDEDEDLTNNSFWLISSADKQYAVTLNPNIQQKCCHLACDICNICIHVYSCTCPDFCIQNTICKHIHYLALKNNYSKDANADQTNIHEENDIAHHLETLSSSNNNLTENTNKLRQEIFFEAHKLQENVKKLEDPVVLKHVLKTLKNENIFTENNTKPVQFMFAAKEKIGPANEKIKKQLTFHSTKKKRISSKYIKKPSSKEISKIKKILQKEEPYVSKNANHDHDYFSM